MRVALANSDLSLKGRLNPLQLSRLEMAATLGYTGAYLPHLSKMSGKSISSIENFMDYTFGVIKVGDIFGAVCVLLYNKILPYDKLIGDEAGQERFNSRLGSLTKEEGTVMSDLYSFALKYGAFPDPLSILVEGKGYDEKTVSDRILSVCSNMGLTRNLAHLAVVAYAAADSRTAQSRR